MFEAKAIARPVVFEAKASSLLGQNQGLEDFGSSSSSRTRGQSSRTPSLEDTLKTSTSNINRRNHNLEKTFNYICSQTFSLLNRPLERGRVKDVKIYT